LFSLLNGVKVGTLLDTVSIRVIFGVRVERQKVDKNANLHH